MQDLVFITGNQHKADYLAKWLGIPIVHQKLDLDEIQSLDLRAVVEDKARRAYDAVGSTVLVEDVSLSFDAFGRLPGTFVKWFIQEIGSEGMCRMLDNYTTRAATAAICYCIFDGTAAHFFESSMRGSIADHPRGSNGFGWDEIFVSDGMDKTRAELDDDEQMRTSMRREAQDQLRAFLTQNK